MTRVLVTGGAGYIGSHTAKALAQAGFEPVTFDNLSTGHRWAVRWGPLVEGDLADADLLRQTLRKYEIEAVIHFAAAADVGESMANPRKYFRNNLVNSLNLLDVMLDLGIDCLVFSSTCATYGLPRSLPMDESHPQRPISPYGESKLFVEQVLQRYGDAYGIRSAALRYFNAAGADPEGELGSCQDPEIRLIPIVIQSALGQRGAVEIFGTDYPTADGTAIRDYVHVTDLATAHISALQWLLDGGKRVALNLGAGRGYSVREVIQMVEEVGGRPVPVREALRRAGDPPAVVAASDLAAQTLGWKPAHSDLQEIVSTAWQWQASPPKFVQP